LAGLQDNVNCKETEVAEMRNQIEELQYEYQKILDRNYKLETHLAEARDKLKGLEAIQIDDKIIPRQDTSITQSSLSLQKVYVINIYIHLHNFITVYSNI
jgi:E3 ubiquitin-protein ligase BRE1